MTTGILSLVKDAATSDTCRHHANLFVSSFILDYPKHWTVEP